MAVPKRLDPADFDWSLSRPFQAWVIGPMVGQHYFWNPEQLPISLVELFTADVERLFPTPLAAKADDPAAKRGSKRPRSHDAVTMRDPSGLNTKASWPRRTAVSLAVAASQMRAVLSSDAVTMCDPSGLKAAEDTSFSWPRRTAISLAVAGSQMRAVLSHDAVTMRDPSGLKAAENTILSLPRRAAISLAVAASQMRAVLSYDAVTMRNPSGLKAAEDTSFSWPRRTVV